MALDSEENNSFEDATKALLQFILDYRPEEYSNAKQKALYQILESGANIFGNIVEAGISEQDLQRIPLYVFPEANTSPEAVRKEAEMRRGHKSILQVAASEDDLTLMDDISYAHGNLCDNDGVGVDYAGWYNAFLSAADAGNTQTLHWFLEHCEEFQLTRERIKARLDFLTPRGTHLQVCQMLEEKLAEMPTHRAYLAGGDEMEQDSTHKAVDWAAEFPRMGNLGDFRLEDPARRVDYGDTTGRKKAVARDALPNQDNSTFVGQFGGAKLTDLRVEGVERRLDDGGRAGSMEDVGHPLWVAHPILSVEQLMQGEDIYPALQHRGTEASKRVKILKQRDEQKTARGNDEGPLQR